MKKIRKVNNHKIAFIQESDIKTLIASKDFIKPEIFSELSIINMECDTEGYFRIENQDNVAYIETLGFIPDFDLLNSLSNEELENLITRINREKTSLYEIITKLCEYKEKLTIRERRLLRRTNYLEEKCRTSIESNVLNANLENVSFESMRQALIAQMNNYIYSIIKYADSKENNHRYLKNKTKNTSI